jgi:hypothetical protein
MADKYGLKATTRFGLGILRSNAIAKMTTKNNNFIAYILRGLFESGM